MVKLIEVPLDIRVSEKKPGRWLRVHDLEKIGQLLGASPRWVYENNMDAGAVSGNHYHEHKSELIVCVHGMVMVELCDRVSGDRCGTSLISDPGSKACKGLLILPGIAHAVRNNGRHLARILVFATGEPREEDDYEFEVISTKGGER